MKSTLRRSLFFFFNSQKSEKKEGEGEGEEEGEVGLSEELARRAGGWKGRAEGRGRRVSGDSREEGQREKKR